MNIFFNILNINTYLIHISINIYNYVIHKLLIRIVIDKLYFLIFVPVFYIKWLLKENC